MLQKIKAVEKLFAKLDIKIQQFKTHSELSCISPCIKCCLKENLEASVLEFLPLAYNIFINNKVDETLKLLETNMPYCILLNHLNIAGQNSDKGCSNYINRGLICRLFGFSASTDKYGALALYTCKDIKQLHFEKIQKIVPNLHHSKIPLLSYWYEKFSAIDPSMANEYHKINESIYLALTKVCYYFENKPKKNIGIKAG